MTCTQNHKTPEECLRSDCAPKLKLCKKHDIVSTLGSPSQGYCRKCFNFFIQVPPDFKPRLCSKQSILWWKGNQNEMD